MNKPSDSSLQRKLACAQNNSLRYFRSVPQARKSLIPGALPFGFFMKV